MNLRHIDPRSIDWMDAMLEGESGRTRKREREPQVVEAEPGLLAAGKSTPNLETVGPPPSPQR